MKKKRKLNPKELSEKDLKILHDLSIDSDLASFMLNVDPADVNAFRYRNKYKDSLREAAEKFRAKMKEQNLEKFGKTHACYNYWSAEDIKYIMTSEDPDSVQAERLNKTIYAIQKKRERETKNRRKRK